MPDRSILHEVVEVLWCVVHNGVAPAPDIIAHPHPTCDMFEGYVDDDCRLVPLYIKEADLMFSQYTVRWQDPCECDSRTGVGEDLWKCDECGEVIRYVDDPNGNVTLTELQPHRNRRVRVVMVTPGDRPGGYLHISRDERTGR